MASQGPKFRFIGNKIYFSFLLNFLFITNRIVLTRAQLASNSLENSPISYLDTIVGGSIALPCDVTPPTRRDSSILVLFYREENKTPIYSVDSRGGSGSSSNGFHWSAASLEGRASMRMGSKGDSGLLLEDVRLEDEGLYRCRVDFEASPTRNSRVQLRVIEPPRRMSVVSSWERERKNSDVIGPYPEGAEVTLSCQVIGGIPPPKVTWWQEGSLLDDISEVRSGGVTRNSLHLAKLTRADLLKVVTCQAVNSNLTTPMTKAVTIDLAYPPSRLRITSGHDSPLAPSSTSDVTTPKEPLLVTCITGQKCPLECQVEGSRPPPLVTWKSSGRTLESEFQTISSPPGAKGTSKDTSFYSTLMLTAEPSDNGAIISCRASSPALPEQAIQDNVKLNVLYKPELKLNVKDRTSLQNVEEGEDVTFECHVDANPIVAEIQWTRNWIPLEHNVSAGVHLLSSGSTLALKGVTRRLSGHYACAAANNRGSGTSNVLELSIKFAPKCSSSHVTSVGVGRAESVNVTCRVQAHPTATIFRWAFNTSQELVDVPFDRQIGKNDSSNTISYLPQNPFDYGDLLCWASNSVGTMKQPCVIKVLPIDKPKGVRGCKVSSNGTAEDPLVVVSCIPGWDGGLPQTFTLEVRKAAHVHARVLAALQHSYDPLFHLRSLIPGEKYLFTVTSANPRGTSPPVTLTYVSPEEVVAGTTNKHSKPESSFLEFLPFIAIFIAVLVVMTTCVSVIACIARSKAAEKARASREKDRKASLESRKTSIQHSLPPDRGKEEVEAEEPSSKDPSEHYCAVHGHERRENEYISYKHYFNNIRDDMETQHLLKSSIGGSAGMDNQFSAFHNNNNNNNARDSIGPCALERHGHKDSMPDFPISGRERYSDGSFRGLAPLASVDSLSGYSTLSNQSSASRKTESSSQKSFRAIPETGPDYSSAKGQDYDYGSAKGGFMPRSLTGTLPSIKVTSFPSSLTPPGCPPQASSPTYSSPSRQYQTSPHFPFHPTPTPSSGGDTSPYSTLSDSSYTTTIIPSLPPPAISTHPIFLNEAFSSSGRPPSFEAQNQERKLSRESSV